MSNLIVQAPINSLSFGQVSYAYLYAMYKAGMRVGVFPIGNVDMSAYSQDAGFIAWLQKSVDDRYKLLHKNSTLLQFWHISRQFQGEQIATDKRILLTYHELGEMTPTEISIINTFDKVLFSSAFSKETAQLYGAKTLIDTFVTPLEPNLEKPKLKRIGNVVQWGITGGKFEKRKNTAEIISFWAERYGNNPNHSLNCLVFNPFMGKNPQEQQQIYFAHQQQLLMYGRDGKKRVLPINNIQFLPHQRTNAEVNDLAAQVVVELSGLSGGEGFNIPACRAASFGSIVPVLNHTGHKEWMFDAVDKCRENIMIFEAGKERPAADGLFFLPREQNPQFNLGNFAELTWNQFNKICDAVEERLKKFQRADSINGDFYDWYSPKFALQQLLTKI